MLRIDNITKFVSFKLLSNAKYWKRKLPIKSDRDWKLINNLLGQKVWLILAVEKKNCTGFKLSKRLNLLIMFMTTLTKWQKENEIN